MTRQPRLAGMRIVRAAVDCIFAVDWDGQFSVAKHDDSTRELPDNARFTFDPFDEVQADATAKFREQIAYFEPSRRVLRRAAEYRSTPKAPFPLLGQYRRRSFSGKRLSIARRVDYPTAQSRS